MRKGLFALGFENDMVTNTETVEVNVGEVIEAEKDITQLHNEIIEETAIAEVSKTALDNMQTDITKIESGTLTAVESAIVFERLKNTTEMVLRTSAPVVSLESDTIVSSLEGFKEIVQKGIHMLKKLIISIINKAKEIYVRMMTSSKMLERRIQKLTSRDVEFMTIDKATEKVMDSAKSVSTFLGVGFLIKFFNKFRFLTSSGKSASTGYIDHTIKLDGVFISIGLVLKYLEELDFTKPISELKSETGKLFNNLEKSNVFSKGGFTPNTTFNTSPTADQIRNKLIMDTRIFLRFGEKRLVNDWKEIEETAVFYRLDRDNIAFIYNDKEGRIQNYSNSISVIAGPVIANDKLAGVLGNGFIDAFEKSGETILSGIKVGIDKLNAVKDRNSTELKQIEEMISFMEKGTKALEDLSGDKSLAKDSYKEIENILRIMPSVSLGRLMSFYNLLSDTVWLVEQFVVDKKTETK